MTERHRLLTLSRLRLIYFVIFAIAFALTEIGRYVLRPFVYRNGIDDFGIADTMGNHLGTITQVFFILGVAHANRREGFLIIAVVVLGYVGYEFVQGALPGSTFDWKDVTATLVGGVLTTLIHVLVHKFHHRKEHTK